MDALAILLQGHAQVLDNLKQLDPYFFHNYGMNQEDEIVDICSKI